MASDACTRQLYLQIIIVNELPHPARWSFPIHGSCTWPSAVWWQVPSAILGCAQCAEVPTTFSRLEYCALFIQCVCVCRSNFDTFPEAALTIFQIISGENWNEVLYDGIQSTSWAAMVYFVLVFMGAQFIIMNLYIAILLRDYETGDPPSMEFLVGILTCGMYNICPDRLQEDWFASEESDNDDDPGSPMELEIEKNLQPIDTADWSLRSVVLHQQEARRRAKVSKKRKLGTNSRCSWVNLDKVYDKDNKADWPLQGKSLLIFSPTNGLRIWLAELVEHPAFEACVLLMILISSVLLVVEFESKFDKDHGAGYALSVSTPFAAGAHY